MLADVVPADIYPWWFGVHQDASGHTCLIKHSTFTLSITSGVRVTMGDIEQMGSRYAVVLTIHVAVVRIWGVIAFSRGTNGAE